MKEMELETELVCFLEEIASHGRNYAYGVWEGMFPATDDEFLIAKLAKTEFEVVFGLSEQIEEQIRDVAPKAIEKLLILPTGATIGDAVMQTDGSFGIYRIQAGQHFYTVILHLWCCEKTWGEEWYECLAAAAEYEYGDDDEDDEYGAG